MDIFDVLTAISKRKTSLIRIGMNEPDALLRAMHDIALEYHIHILDIKRLIG